MATPIIDTRGYELVPEAPIDPQAFNKGAALAQMISGRKQQAADAEKQRYGGILAQLLRAGSEEEYNAMLNNFSQMNQDPDILSDLNYLGQIGMGEGMNVAGAMLRGYGMESSIPTAKAGDSAVLSPGQQLVSKTSGQVIAENLKDTLTGKDQFDQAAKLRAEILKADPDYRKIEDAFGRVKTSAIDPSPAGDLSLIFNYMKMLDPGSTVREGEFANAQNAGGVDDAVVNIYNRIREGTRLNEEQRRDFVGRSEMLYNTQKGLYDQRVEEILTLADEFGIPRKFIKSEKPVRSKEEGSKSSNSFRAKFDDLPEEEKIKFLQKASPEQIKKLGIF